MINDEFEKEPKIDCKRSLEEPKIGISSYMITIAIHEPNEEDPILHDY